ncbi:hypothetical protein [Hyphomonas sp.]|uniref:hypothetical protein n=1 Tax=Hyphomonas sp. TaxID=87 RepID=UPI003919D4CC
MTLPMKCVKCGTVFTSRAFRIVGAKNIHFANNWETCPYCGGRARSIDGVYDMVDEIVVAIRPLNRDARRTLKSILEDARKDNFRDGGLIDAVSEVAPEVGAILRRAKAGEFSQTAVMIFILLVFEYVTSGSLVNYTKNEINVFMEQAKVQAALIEAASGEGYQTDDDHQPPETQHARVEPGKKATLEEGQIAESDAENLHGTDVPETKPE